MGQSQMNTLREHTPTQVVLVQEKMQEHVAELKQIAEVSYAQFLQSVDTLNETTKCFCDVNGKQLTFKVKPGTDKTFLWKATVRIKCFKVNSRTGLVESCRILNLKQYIHLCNEIHRQATLATLKPEDKLASFTASMILSEAECHGAGTEENECCICMDHKAEIILSCNHSYCEQCIDQWHLTHRNCPECRTVVTGSDDTWVLTEKPDSNEMAYETTGYLMGLADRTGQPQ